MIRKGLHKAPGHVLGADLIACDHRTHEAEQRWIRSVNETHSTS